MSGFACPKCDRRDYVRWRTPKTIADVTFRRHRCQNCHAIFQTAQVVLVGGVAEKILDILEMNGSELMPNASAISLRALLDTIRDEDSTTTSATRASSPVGPIV